MNTIDLQDTLTIADQQRLADGQAHLIEVRLVEAAAAPHGSCHQPGGAHMGGQRGEAQLNGRHAHLPQFAPGQTTPRNRLTRSR